MRTVLLLTSLLGLLSCGPQKNGGEAVQADTIPLPPQAPPPGITISPADPVMDTLLKLPFIVKSNRYIDSLTRQKQGISFMTDTLENTYEIRAGYNGPERFETYYHLSVDKKTLEIKVMDPIGGDYMPLKDYLINNQ